MGRSHRLGTTFNSLFSDDTSPYIIIFPTKLVNVNLKFKLYSKPLNINYQYILFNIPITKLIQFYNFNMLKIKLASFYSYNYV